jgi:transposase
MTLDKFTRWAPEHLRKTDAVVIEASTNTWTLYDLVMPLVGQAVVVQPPKVKLIGSARVKTDKLDVFKLAKLLLVGWVPPAMAGSRRKDAGNCAGLWCKPHTKRYAPIFTGKPNSSVYPSASASTRPM